MRRIVEGDLVRVANVQNNIVLIKNYRAIVLQIP